MANPHLPVQAPLPHSLFTTKTRHQYVVFGFEAGVPGTGQPAVELHLPVQAPLTRSFLAYMRHQYVVFGFEGGPSLACCRGTGAACMLALTLTAKGWGCAAGRVVWPRGSRSTLAPDAVLRGFP